MRAAIVLMLTNNKEQELHEMLRSAEIPEAIREEWAVKTVTRAIKRGRKKTAPTAWLEWADKWLSGEDRTEGAVQATYKATFGCNVPSGQTLKGSLQAASALVDTEPYMIKNNFRYQSISSLCLNCANWSVACVNNSFVSWLTMYVEITKQLDDLLALIDAYKEEEEEESISDKLFNANITNLEQTVAEIAGERGEDCLDFIKDVLSGGCINGTVSELIYTDDCVAFYRLHKKDIQKLVTELMSDCGEDSMKGLFGDKFDCEDPFCEGDENQNLLAWFGFEEALRTLANRIELDI